MLFCVMPAAVSLVCKTPSRPLPRPLAADGDGEASFTYDSVQRRLPLRGIADRLDATADRFRVDRYVVDRTKRLASLSRFVALGLMWLLVNVAGSAVFAGLAALLGSRLWVFLPRG